VPSQGSDAVEAEKLKGAAVWVRMQYFEPKYGLSRDTKPWGRSRRSSDRGRNAERVSPGDEPGRVSWEGNASKGGTP